LLALLDGNYPDSWSVCHHLAQMGPAARDAIPALRRLVAGKKYWLPVAHALTAAAGPDAPPEVVADVLTVFLRDKDNDYEYTFLADLGSSAAPGLAAMLSEPSLSPGKSIAVLNALAKFGPKAKGVGPLPDELLQARDEWVRAAAAEAVIRLDASDKRARKVLLEMASQSTKPAVAR